MDLILNPINLQDFISSYWESELLHVSRKDSAHFENILSVLDIEKYVSTEDLSFPEVQAVDSSRSIKVADYTQQDKKIVPQQLMQLHREGATVVVSHAHKKIDALNRLCREVNKSFQMRCQANVYLSPAGNQGFKSHYDTHDVFILQVSGSKTFRFFSSEIELPFPDDTYHPENNQAADVLAEAKLTAGDTLYIPRGMVHDALASEQDSSLHITLGVFPFVVRDLLQQMMQVAAERNVVYRSSVTKLQGVDGLKNLSSDFLDDLLTDEIYNEASARLADELATESTLAIKHAAVDPNVEAAIGAAIDFDATITVNNSEILNFERSENELILRLLGQVLRFTDPLASAVEALLRQQSMQVGLLPGINDEQKRALCDHLVQASVASIGTD